MEGWAGDAPDFLSRGTEPHAKPLETRAGLGCRARPARSGFWKAGTEEQHAGGQVQRALATGCSDSTGLIPNQKLAEGSRWALFLSMASPGGRWAKQEHQELHKHLSK